MGNLSSRVLVYTGYMCMNITEYYLFFLYSFTYTLYTILITIPCNIIFIMGVQLPLGTALIQDLDFEITNSGSSEGRIFQIDFDNELPLVSQLDSIPYEVVHS